MVRMIIMRRIPDLTTSGAVSFVFLSISSHEKIPCRMTHQDNRRCPTNRRQRYSEIPQNVLFPHISFIAWTSTIYFISPSQRSSLWCESASREEGQSLFTPSNISIRTGRVTGPYRWVQPGFHIPALALRWRCLMLGTAARG